MKAKSVKYVLLGMALVLGLAMPVQAQLAAVGPVDQVTGFPIWFEDAAGLRLQLCDQFDPNGVLVEQAPCLPELIDPNGGFVDGNIGEALYFAVDGETTVEVTGEFIRAQCVLEAAGPELPGGTNTVANAALIRIRGLTTSGDYEVVTPCATFTFTFPFAEIDETEFRAEIVVEGLPTDDPPFSGALGLGNPDTPVHFFASNGTGDPGFLGNGGGPLEGSVGLLSNPLRPAGPTSVTFFRDDELIATIDEFMVVGKISGCTEDNVAPIAVNDVAVTTIGIPVVIDVLANDSDVVVTDPIDEPPVTEIISPPVGTVAIVTPPALDSGTAVVNPDNTVTFTPAADFAGQATFAYTVTDPCGLQSNPATVTVLVEDLRLNQADYRVRTGKWTLNGTSNFSDLSFAAGEGLTAYPTALVGGQEVPPVNTSAAGFAVVIIPDTAPLLFDIIVEVDVQPVAPITRAHIHLGETGVNGGRLFDLCGEVGTLPEEGTLECVSMENFIATLTAAEVRAVGDIEAGDFNAAIQAIRDGRTYVNVHTDVNQGGFPAGEIRGQLGRNVIVLKAGEAGPVITAVEVGEDESWSFSGKANLAPAGEEGVVMVEAESSLGQVETRQLRLR